MISKEALRIRGSLQRDSISNDVVANRLAWEESARQIETPKEVGINIMLLAGVQCMSHKAQDEDDTDDLIVYIHGGGLVEGSIETSRHWCSRLAKATRKTVISIDYRLAPEHPYPAGLDDVLAVIHALNKNQPRAVIKSIGADSSGCNLLLGALFQLRKEGSELAQSVFLLSPSIDLTFSGDSFASNKDNDPFVSSDVLELYARYYAGGRDLSSQEISPIFGSFEKLPPMLVLVDSDELLLDDANRLTKRVRESAGFASLIVAQGLWHAWPTWGEFPEAQLALEQLAEHIQNSD